MTSWGRNGELGFELYDHKSDKEELINLASQIEYKRVFDSLKIVLQKRVADAQLKPSDLGRQFEKVNELQKAPNITYRDLHDAKGKRTYFKPADE